VLDAMLLAVAPDTPLERLGSAALGPAKTVPGALALLSHRRPDAAWLHLDLTGRTGTAVAATLAAQGVPSCRSPDTAKRWRRA
jgi:hypothetical protein